MGKIYMDVSAIGLGEVFKRLDRINEIPQRSAKALTAGAKVVLRAAHDLAPVRTGYLKSKLAIGRRKKTRDRHAVEVGIFGNDPGYAHWVEGGHGGPKPAPAHPFLETAAEMTETEAIDAIMEALKKEL